MNVVIEPGTYVIAVSGGVDSVVLLDILRQQSGVRLTVAHFDHGIREDAASDRLFVQTLAEQYGLPFVYEEGRLGAGSSEATARQARYEFLRRVKVSSKSQAVITAHHQDDVLETAIINLLRGSGRKGLTSLASQADIRRPLLDIPKRDLIAYAKNHNLQWREDSTNQDDNYLRNYVRHQLLPKFDYQSRTDFQNIISGLRITNQQLDDDLAGELEAHSMAGNLDRLWFNQLPHTLAKEMMASWLRVYGVRGFDSHTLERLVVAAKVGQPGSKHDVLNNVILGVQYDNLALNGRER